jgi:hypothetical protein
MIVDVSVIGVFCSGDAARVALLRLPGEARAANPAANFCNDRRSVPSADVLSSQCLIAQSSLFERSRVGWRCVSEASLRRTAFSALRAPLQANGKTEGLTRYVPTISSY